MHQLQSLSSRIRESLKSSEFPQACFGVSGRCRLGVAAPQAPTTTQSSTADFARGDPVGTLRRVLQKGPVLRASRNSPGGLLARKSLQQSASIVIPEPRTIPKNIGRTYGLFLGSRISIFGNGGVAPDQRNSRDQVSRNMWHRDVRG